MGRRRTPVAAAVLLALAGCHPYESRTLQLGERGIQPVLLQMETTDSREDDARRAAQRSAEREMHERMMRDAAERQQAMAPSSVPPWPGEDDSNQKPRLGSDFPRPRASFPERPDPVVSPEFDACVARYERYRRELDRYEKEAPDYIMVRTTVGKEPERVSCSRVKSYARMGGDRGELYRQYLGRCTPLPRSGEVYDAAKTKVDETHRECLTIARRAGITPGEARSRLR